jgi:hypothetical protein
LENEADTAKPDAEAHLAGKLGRAPGGAVFVLDSKDFAMRRCWFERNRAANRFSAGGAVYGSIHCELQFKDCTFVNNYAPFAGGAAFLFQSTLSAELGTPPTLDPATAAFINCSFQDNFTAFFHPRNPPVAKATELYVNDGYSAKVIQCEFRHRASLLPLLVAAGAGGGEGVKENPCTLVLNSSTFASPLANNGLDQVCACPFKHDKHNID